MSYELDEEELVVIEAKELDKLLKLNGSDEHPEAPGKVLAGAHNRAELRSLVITGPVDEDMSAATCAKLLTFAAEDMDTPIVLYVNTYGGSVYDMMAIYDVMQFIKPDIYTVGFGKVMSAGVLLLAAAQPGHRFALPHTSIMIHKVRGGALGTAEDIESSSDHIKHMQKEMERLLAKHTKINKTKMKEFMSGSDVYLNPKQAKELGIIDHMSAVMPKVLV